MKPSRRFWNSEPQYGNSFGKMRDSDVSATCVVIGGGPPADTMLLIAFDPVVLLSADVNVRCMQCNVYCPK